MKSESSLLTEELINELFKDQKEVHWSEFQRIVEQQLSWILEPSKSCIKVIERAGIELKHKNLDEGNRELLRKYKKQEEQTKLLDEMKEKFKREEEMNRAVSDKLDKFFHDENDLHKIVNEI